MVAGFSSVPLPYWASHWSWFTESFTHVQVRVLRFTVNVSFVPNVVVMIHWNRNSWVQTAMGPPGVNLFQACWLPTQYACWSWIFPCVRLNWCL